MTCTFSTRGAAPSTNLPRATAVLFMPFSARLGVAPVDQLVRREARDRARRRAGRPAPASSTSGSPATGSETLAVGADDAQPAGLLGDQHLAVGQERQAPRVVQPFGDGHDVERDVGLPLGRAGLAGERRLLVRRVRWARVHPVLRAASGRATAAAGARGRAGRRLGQAPGRQVAERPRKSTRRGPGRPWPPTGISSSSAPFCRPIRFGLPGKFYFGTLRAAKRLAAAGSRREERWQRFDAR